MNKRQIDLFHKLDVKFNRLSFREHLIIGEAIKELQKQVEIDAKQIRALQKQNRELTDKIRELENRLENIRYYLDNEIPHDLINEATTKIWRMLK